MVPAIILLLPVAALVIMAAGTPTHGEARGQARDGRVGQGGNEAAASYIRPYERNRFYWQYKGKPLVLIGGSDKDNLFQWAGHGTRLVEHLDLLVSCGGNYVRNTMSSRNLPFPYNDDGMAYPFKRRDDGKYDLEQWDDEYWRRLDTFLAETSKRGIIVQLEIWDLYAIVGPDAWERQPWNPANNVNYTFEGTSLTRRGGFSHPFFLTVPALNDDREVLGHQVRYIRKMLGICLRYDHVLYQIDNESPLPFEVSDYWAEFIHNESGARPVYVCDSRRFHAPSPIFEDFRDLRNPEHTHPLSHPELYNYTDISQNGGNEGQRHYENLIWFRAQLLDDPRPINHTKIYQFAWRTGQGWKDRLQGTPKDGADKFWRTIFGGAASARHHRHVPEEVWGGIGLTPFGQTQLRSMRMLLDAMWIFTMEPRNDLLSAREENEAYALAEPGRQYAVYFTGYGDRSVGLDLSAVRGVLALRWLDVGASAWRAAAKVRGGGTRQLSPPGEGEWAVLVTRE